MSNSSSGNVGIVIVSHSSKIAEGAADMVRQMVGNAVPLAWTGGDTDGGLGTNVAGILEAIEAAWSILAGRKRIRRWRWRCWLKIDARASLSAMRRWLKAP
jgi:hypothetical protein